MLAWQIKNNYWFTWRELGMTIIFGYFKLVVAFTILHRFFAHKAFSASRPMTFFLGLVALTVSDKDGADHTFSVCHGGNRLGVAVPPWYTTVLKRVD